MSGRRRWAAGCLGGAFLLAMGTPAYLAHAQPSLGIYLLQPWIFVLQGLPYSVAATLWIPSWAWGSEGVSFVMSIAISVTTTAVVVLISGLTALRSWLR